MLIIAIELDEPISAPPFLARQLSVFVTMNLYGGGREIERTMVTQGGHEAFRQVRASRRIKTLRPVFLYCLLPIFEDTPVPPFICKGCGGYKEGNRVGYV